MMRFLWFWDGIGFGAFMSRCVTSGEGYSEVWEVVDEFEERGEVGFAVGELIGPDFEEAEQLGLDIGFEDEVGHVFDHFGVVDDVDEVVSRVEGEELEEIEGSADLADCTGEDHEGESVSDELRVWGVLVHHVADVSEVGGHFGQFDVAL